MSYQNSDRYSDALNSVAQVKTVNPTQGKKHFAALFTYFNVSQNAFLFTHHATVIGEAENATDNKEKKTQIPQEANVDYTRKWANIVSSKFELIFILQIGFEVTQSCIYYYFLIIFTHLNDYYIFLKRTLEQK